MHWFIDLETQSLGDISGGVTSYCKHPSFKILMLAFRSPDMPKALVYDYECPELNSPETKRLYQAMCDDKDAIFIAHNLDFESKAILCNTQGIPLKISLVTGICTANMCARAAIPAALGRAGEFLYIEQGKHSFGAVLMRKFSIPDKDGKFTKPEDAPEEWEQYKEYCARDVDAEVELFRKLNPIFRPTKWHRVAENVTRHINRTGISINLPAVKLANDYCSYVQDEANKEFVKLTGLKTSQNAKLREWLHARGIACKSLSAASMPRLLVEASKDPEAKKALLLLAKTSFSAVKKLPTMLAANVDSVIHDSLRYHGASTGRWSSVIVQTQNLKRSTKRSAALIELLDKDGTTIDDLDFVLEGNLAAVAESVRHFFRPPTGEWFQADYASIEARIVAWVAGATPLLDLFRGGKDPYKAMASVIYGVPYDDVNSEQRFLGKQAILGCGYGMGVARFREQCASYGVNLSEELCEKAVQAYRNTYPEIPKFWYATEREFTDACKKPVVDDPSKTTARCFRTWLTTDRSDTTVLYRLPSGRFLSYPKPRVTDDGFTYMGKRQGSTTFQEIRGWGGLLVENICQAIAADVMTMGAFNLIKAGYQPAALIHDEALVYPKDGGTVDEVVELLCAMPPWAAGLPLKAEGQTMKHYKK